MAEKRKHLPEDVVEYFLFPKVPDSVNVENVLKYLEESLDSYLAFISPFIVDYIWQNEPFTLVASVEDHHKNINCTVMTPDTVKPELMAMKTSTGDLPPHLHGRTSFGDNIDDEWFIVYLLYLLTKHFPGLVARVIDNDEEFVLIETAEFLPKWVNPDTAENRVYIYNGNLHIIPIPQSPAESTTLPSSTPSVEDAVICVRNFATSTVANSSVQAALHNRIDEFPAKNQENTHYAHCYVPANLAALLNRKPSLVAQGVQAFYYRDPIDLKCCRTFRNFQPGTRVTTRVKFTRCLYAQLMQQNFQPDRRSGWVLPTTHSPKYKSHDLGMKLAHGFEILCAKCKANNAAKSNGNTEMSNDIRWNRYFVGLKERGYFRGEVEGSKLYKELLESAKEFYHDQISTETRQDKYKCVGTEILSLLNTVQYDIEAMRRAEDSLLPPDDDDWLNLTPDTLDEILKKKALSNTMGDKGEDSFDLSKVADSMKTFVDKMSGLDGAEFPGEGEDDEDDVQFDSTGFISAMQKMFEFEDNDSDSSSDMSEYGWSDSDADVDDQPPSSKGKKAHRQQAKAPTVSDYMQQMDKELSKTNVGQSFEKQTNGATLENKSKLSNKNIDDEDDEFKPVNIDLNIVKNMLDSIGAQQGLAGPATNILGPMGVSLPPPEDECELKSTGTETMSDSPIAPPRRKAQKSTPAKSFSTESTSSPPPRPALPPRPSSAKSKPPPRPSQPPRTLRTKATVQKETTI